MIDSSFATALTSQKYGPLTSQTFIPMLHRYWLVTNPEDRYGSKNFGVTPLSPQHAKSILKSNFERSGGLILLSIHMACCRPALMASPLNKNIFVARLPLR